MKILSLDIATNTGYSILEDGNLISYGMINIPQEMNLFQRISFFELNITRIIDSFKPDYVAIEDVLLGISGAKTLAYLARLNGIALSCAYKKVQNNIKLFMPSEWKANSFDDLNGNAKKVDIQISVCKHFKLIPENELSEIIKPLDNANIDVSNIELKIKLLKEDTKKYIAYLNRKRNGASDQEKKAFQHKIEENKVTLQKYKDYIKESEKKIDDIYKNVSLQIMSKCGLTCDVSDSIGIGYCLYKSLTK